VASDEFSRMLFRAIFYVKIVGKQTHGAMPWCGIDPVVISSQVILGLQTIPTRQLDITKTPSVLSVTTVHGGNRENIIPNHVDLSGTTRTFDEKTRVDMRQKIVDTCQNIAKAGGGTAHVEIRKGYDIVDNDEKLTTLSVGVLKKVLGEEKVRVMRYTMGAEDFSVYQKKSAGILFFRGVCT